MKNNEFQTSAGWFLALMGILLLNALVLILWTHKDERPLAWDESVHTTIAMDYREQFGEEGFSALFKPAVFNYPPLYHLPLALVLNWTVDVADAGAVVNFFYLALLIVCVFMISDFLMGRWAALTSAFLVSCYPIFVQMARLNILDVALSAWVTFAMLCLIRSDNLSKIGWSAGFGLGAALAWLTKWPAPGYLLIPALFSLWVCLRKKTWKGPLAACLIFLAVAGPWYSANWIPVLKRVVSVADSSPAAEIPLPPGFRFLWYVAALLHQMDLVFVLLLIPGLAAIFWRPKLTPVFLWFVGPIFLFSLITNHNLRYTMPGLPAAAVLSAAWLSGERRMHFVSVIALTCFYFLLVHFIPGPSWVIKTKIFQAPVLSRQEVYKGQWPIRPIIKKILELKGPDGRFSRVLTISNAPFFHSTPLNVIRRLEKADSFAFKGPSKKRTFELYDFVLLKTGDLGPPNSTETAEMCSRFINDPGSWFKQVYKEAARWPLPDNSEAVLFICDPVPVKTAGMDLFNIELKELVLPNIVAKGVKFKAIGGSSADMGRGQLRDLRMECREVVYKGVTLEKVVLHLVNPQINLPLFLNFQEIQLLKLDKLDPKAELNVEPLVEYLQAKTKGLKDLNLEFQDSLVKLSGTVRGIPLEIKLAAFVRDRFFFTQLKGIKIFRIPLPSFFFRAATDFKVPLMAYSRAPFDLNIREIRGESHKLEINP